MIGKYKIAALCTCRIQDSECFELIHELDGQLDNIGCRLFVYNCISRPEKNSISAETAVFDLIDPSFCDVVIIQSDCFGNYGFCKALVQKYRDMGLPVISLGENISDCINFEYRQSDGFADIVSHMVKYHGYTSIHMIAGVKGEYYSDERIKAFRNVLSENNIPFDDSMISYGDYWSVPAIAAVEKLIKENRLPRAIVCANDHMAVAVTNYLQDQGISVPDDVAITGYDGIETIYSTDPTVSSSGIYPLTNAKKICHTVNKIFSEGYATENIPLFPELIINESCGCKSEKRRMKFNSSAPYNELMNKFYRFQDENIILSNVSEHIQQCKSFEDIAAEMRKDDLMYAMTCVIKSECIDESVNPEEKIQMRFGDNMFVLYDSDDIDQKKSRGEKFIPYNMDGRDIIPNMNGFIGRCLIFTALSYLGVPMGYTCYHFSSYIPSNYYKIPQTVNMLNNALGGLRNLRHQHYLLNKVDEISRIDALTGLFNRHGFLIEYENILRGLGSNSLAVIMCDLDGLKAINDKYGHDNGDFAIKNTAQALKRVCPPNAACTRFGGDEIMAVFPCCGTENNIRGMLYKELDCVNERSGKPYKIAASVGIYITQNGEKPSFDELIRYSDKLMYEEKKRRKTLRTN